MFNNSWLKIATAFTVQSTINEDPLSSRLFHRHRETRQTYVYLTRTSAPFITRQFHPIGTENTHREIIAVIPNHSLYWPR